MQVHILTIFPEIFDGFFKTSLIDKALQRGLFTVALHNIRDFADPPHYQVDDSPYGGGAGMVMKPEPIVRAVEHAKRTTPAGRTILLTPSGPLLTQQRAVALSAETGLILICGRYEGVDQRAIDLVVDEEISIGDYVLMGGEVPAMVLIEAAVRHIADVVGNKDSLTAESFAGEALLLEGPQYTKPAQFRGRKVPEQLISGNHELIGEWRREQAVLKTERARPDLLAKKGGQDRAP